MDEALKAIAKYIAEHFPIISLGLAAAFGGLVRYLRSQKYQNKAVRLGEALLEMASSCIAGTTVGLIVLHYSDNPVLAMAVASYAGHIGASKIYLLINKLIERKQG